MVDKIYTYQMISRGISFEKRNPVLRYTKPIYMINQIPERMITSWITSKRGLCVEFR